MPVVDVTQYKEVFHVPKENFRNIIVLEDLSLEELRVFCYLLTDLPGFNTIRRINTGKEYVDPCNFRKVDAEVVATELGYSEKKVKKAIKKLVELSLLEKGNGPSVKGGYRFTF